MKNIYIFFILLFALFMYIGLLGGGNLIRVPARQYAPKRPKSIECRCVPAFCPDYLVGGVGDRDLCRDGSWEGRSVPYKLLAIPAAGIL
jgi:hypothetical protein